MCLYVDKELTKAVKIKAKSSNGWIVCWKVFVHDRHNRRIVTPYQNYVVDIMTNELVMEPIMYNETISLSDQFHEGEIDNGIHVFFSYDRAEELCNYFNDRFAVRVWGHVDDLIAVGRNEDVVFKKILIDETAYQRLLDEVYGKDVYTTEYCDEQGYEKILDYVYGKDVYITEYCDE